MTGVTNKPAKKRIFYFDALRTLAICCVIIIHIFSQVKHFCVPDFTSVHNLNWFICSLMGNFSRIGVDLFLMLSGALSMGRVWEIKPFLSKRITRIVLPFIFWCITLPCVLILLQYSIPYVHIISSFTAENITRLFVNAFTAKSFFGPYWFFWMILGTYLIMPVFNKWLLHSDLAEAEYFLVFWLITCLFDFTLNVPFPIKLSYFTSPIGLVVLGYYLRHTKRKIFTNLYFPVILIISVTAVQTLCCYLFSTKSTIFVFDRYSILMAFEVMGIFLLYRNLEEKHVLTKAVPEKIKAIFKKSVMSIARYSYGMYLIFNVILVLNILTLKHLDLYYRFKVDSVVLFIATLLISWFIMAALNRVPYLNQIIGAK